MIRPNLTVSTHDARRLEALLQGETGRDAPMASLLEQELGRAPLLDPPPVPSKVVTIDSRVVCPD